MWRMARRISGAMANGGNARSSGVTQTEAPDRKVLQIARKLAATIGTDFFQAIAKHLTQAVEADCALIGEFVGGQMESVSTLGAYMDGQPVHFEFELAGSAAAAIALGKSCQIRSDALSRYPSDQLLTSVGAHAIIGLPLLDPQGHPTGLIAALYRHPVVGFKVTRQLLDIFSGRAAAELNRKREEEELRKTEQRYRAFIARNPDAMWRIEFEQPIDMSLSIQEQVARMNRLGYLAECNDAMAVMLGMEKATQAIGARLEDIASNADAEDREAALNAIRNGHEFTTVETSMIDGRGNRRYLLRSQWGIVEDGMLERVWGTTRDVTDLKQSEQALDASRQRMSDLLETVSLIVMIEDLEGAVTYCNRHFFRKTGWRPSGILGHRWLDLMVPGEERQNLQKLFEQARSKPGASVHFEATLLGTQSQRLHFDWDRTLLRDTEGHPTGWANIGRDVTQHRIVEAQLRESQKLATIGKLAGGVAHDFNNLLTVILGYSVSLLQEQNNLDPTAYTALDEIRKAASKGAELTHRLLAFGRRQILRPEVLNLNLLIADAEQMLRRLMGDNIHVTTLQDPELGLVRIDGSSFHQVLMNLAVNARDAMPQGGSLLIATSNATIGAFETASPLVPGEYVQVTVSDTGVGMTEEVRDHLFEPFFTTKEQGKGTGLGLSVVYGIIQQSGGNILVDSTPGKGSTFRIYFPCVKVMDQSPPESEAPPEIPRGSETVLLVEDRDDVRKLTARILRGLGYTVIEADGVQHAVEYGQNRGRTIHLLLTDISMPGPSGFELAEQMRTYQSAIKVLFMSGSPDPSRFSERLTAIPNSAYLQKPFSIQALASSVRSLLDRR